MINIRKSKKNNSGFTLAELIVVITIMTVVTTAVLTSGSKYSEKLNLRSQSYNLVLFLREAQVYSLSVKGAPDAGGNTTFNTSYGVVIGTLAQNKISFFTDTNLNGVFDASEPSRNFNFTKGIYIRRICGIDIVGAENCIGIDRVDVTFKRPDPAATAKFLNSSGAVIPTFTLPAIIYLQTPSDNQVVVKVDSTGQIGAQ